MFAFLYKRIPIPDDVKITAVAWSHEYNCIAIGCEDRRVHLIKPEPISLGKGQPSGRSFNITQQLTGHKGIITVCKWNEVYQKLTTGDNRGMIVMWSLIEDRWTEFMVNERADTNSSVVSVHWSPDGHMLCIIYEDGYFVVAAVDGSRLWDFKLEVNGLRVQWSPDSKLILIAVKSSKPTVLIFDDHGNKLQNFKVNLSALDTTSVSPIVGVHWNSFYSNIGHTIATPNLAVTLSNGKIQLMRNESDPSPIVVNAEMTITCSGWNHTGSVIAVGGKSDSESRGCLVKFFSPSGHLMQSLRLHGKKLTSLSWDKEGLRVALAIDSYLFFASIKPHYEWTYFGDTVVYTLSKCVSDSTMIDETVDDTIDVSSGDIDSSSVIFYNFKSRTRRTKHLKKLMCIAGTGSHCVLAIKNDSSASRSLEGPSTVGSTLILCNSLGTATEKRVISFTASCVCMTTSLVIVASRDSVTTWQYRSFNLTSHRWNTDDGGNLVSSQRLPAEGTDDDDCATVDIGHLIRCMRSSEKNICIGLEKGEVMIYSLPKMAFTQSITIDRTIPAFVSLNCDSSKLAVIDSTSTLTMYDLEADSDAKKIETLEKKDVWSFMWSADEASTFAFTEKNKLLLFQDMEAEETVHATGYLCSFSGFEVKSVDLDALINREPSENEAVESFISTLETRVLTEIRALLTKEDTKDGFARAIDLADSHNSDKLWKLIADHSLRSLAFEEAELAFIRCKDYLGLQFLKRLSQLQSDNLKRGEVAAFFGDLDLAESIFLDADRRDLAIDIRKKNWQPLQVLRLIEGDRTGLTDAQVKEAMTNAAEYYVDHLDWPSAIEFYERSGDLEKVIDAYSATEQFEELSVLMHNNKLTDEGYLKAAHAFLTVGMCDDAVSAFVAINRITEAIDTCVMFNEWQTALRLAQENSIDEIDDLLAQYAAHLLSEKKHFDIIELYKKANRIHDAANMVLKLIEDVKRENQSTCSPILMKQLYTLIGLLYSSEKKQSEKRNRSDGTFIRKNTLTSLLREDESLIAAAATFRAVDRPWRGAEAFHFYILAHKHLYNGDVDCAMKAAYFLLDYDDILGAESVFALLALTACANRCFSLCSRALLRLETLETIEDSERDAYQSLAISIFSQFSPKESSNIAKAECTHCETLIPDYLSVCPSCNTSFKICTATAKPIMDASLAWTCRRCQHSAFKTAITSLDHCPLCHEAIPS